MRAFMADRKRVVHGEASDKLDPEAMIASNTYLRVEGGPTTLSSGGGSDPPSAT